LGTVMIFASSQQMVGAAPTLVITTLIRHAPELNPVLLHLGFIFCLLGYGTKAGIFPMHNWLPDAHSEAPAPASAMLSGALLNCALFGIWRVANIVETSMKVPHAMQLIMIMGAITAVAGSLFLIRQHSFKRMWAYSSIENVGIMLTTIGMGSGPLFFLQALNHSLVKVALFLVSGNIIQAAGTKRLSGLHGVLEAQPTWAILLLLAAFAATGTPPFGMFTSEFQILMQNTTVHRWPIALALLTALTIGFVAISVHIFRVVCGSARPNFNATRPVASSVIPVLLVLCSLALGLLIPPTFWTSIH
jgi:hydrogenase-4 component F